jgi:asparagine synthase (glutamine-hydrolysing)
MCGIAGGVGPSAPSLQALEAQLTKLEHRGPDDRGTYVNQGISLGMCRLAIVEIAAGKQPFESADGKINIVFNGEIYNYRELREELVALGHEFIGQNGFPVLDVFLGMGVRTYKNYNQNLPEGYEFTRFTMYNRLAGNGTTLSAVVGVGVGVGTRKK